MFRIRSCFRITTGPCRSSERAGFARLELVLLLVALGLACQLFPSLWLGSLKWLNLLKWPRSVWLVLNAAVVLVLLFISLLPTLLAGWQRRRQLLALEHEKKAEKRKLAEQREVLRRLRDARKRQVY
jgi:uncharacterized membrane protein YcjF (UPF0283 family)